jgi:sulfur relay (sulfurtransferase) DsrC/TusE family protein
MEIRAPLGVIAVKKKRLTSQHMQTLVTQRCIFYQYRVLPPVQMILKKGEMWFQLHDMLCQDFYANKQKCLDADV